MLSERPPSMLSAQLKAMALPGCSPSSKPSLTSPKRGQRREDGWKEVVRRWVPVLAPSDIRLPVWMHSFQIGRAHV